MPSDKSPPDARVVTSRLFLDLIRIGVRPLFGNVPAAPRALDVLLLCAVAVGAVEGRPMNAGKLAHFGDVPRPTAVRRLAAMQRGGIVSRLRCGAYTLGPAIPEHMSQAVAQECARAIQRAAAELSKLDT